MPTMPATATPVPSIFRRPRVLGAAALAACATAVAAPAAAEAAPSPRCEASALRGSILGQAPIEPVVANKNTAACADDAAGLGNILPAPLATSAVFARTDLEETAGRPDLQRAAAVGGIAGLNVGLLPSLPIQLPIDQIDQLLAPVAQVTLPISGLLQVLLGPSVTLDLRPALHELLPEGRLPNVSLVSVDALSATARARCVAGQPTVETNHSITGLRVLGQEVVPEALLNDTVNLIDTAHIDPSDIDLSLVQVPLLSGILTPITDPILGGLVQPLLQPVLDALPTIEIPATVARIVATAGAKHTDSSGLTTQQALRLQVAIAGQPVADLSVGEAAVSAAGLDCTPPQQAPPPPPPSADDIALQCADRRVVLEDVSKREGRVRLLGFAHKDLIGKTVNIRFAGDEIVARTKVRDDGTFRATAEMPSKRIRSTNKARYQAEVDGHESLDLKLERRMALRGMRAEEGRILISGQISSPRISPAPSIEVRSTTSCEDTEVIARVKPDKDGTFRFRVDNPKDASAAIIRLTTRVHATKTSKKTYETFSLPRSLDLKK